MAYDYKNAIKATLEYLNIQDNDITYIENTNERGFIYELEDEKIVIFIAPIGCKKNNTQNWIDTRDSGVKERKITYKYAVDNSYKYFFLCVNSEQERYKDFFFSIESNEEKISDISFRKKESVKGTGTQVNIPRQFIPKRKFERICTDKGVWISAIKKDYINDYLMLFDNRLYDESFYKNTSSIEENKLGEKIDIKEQTNIGYNKIFYGIPGCGKSYTIDAMLNHKPGFEDEAIKNKITTRADESDVIRTTFYLDYSNSDFIGQIYPCVEKEEVKNSDGSIGYKNLVTYKRIPGPFTKALLRAYQHLIDNDSSQVYLIIEEINRGNAAAIFGDVFQLLDRKNGDSEYPINNEFIESYLKENLENIDNLPPEYNLERIIIPHNLTIFATMNTSDQNVFPLDTAFKRRWKRERVVNDWDRADNELKKMYIPFSNITWEQFAKTINGEMISRSLKRDAPISEDKQMGTYFATKDMLTDKSYSEKKEKKLSLDEDLVKLNNFENNVLDYLYNDVTKFDHSILFENQLYSADAIYERMNRYASSILNNLDNKEGTEKVETKCLFSDVLDNEITDKMVRNSLKVDGKNEKEN